jgi:hypothetical protein
MSPRKDERSTMAIFTMTVGKFTSDGMNFLAIGAWVDSHRHYERIELPKLPLDAATLATLEERCAHIASKALIRALGHQEPLPGMA